MVVQLQKEVVKKAKKVTDCHEVALIQESQGHRKPRSQTKWSTNIKSVDEINDEGLPMDMATSTRLSRVCGLAAWQRVPLTLDTFDDLSDNDKK
jgi:hypothetical protein